MNNKFLRGMTTEAGVCGVACVPAPAAHVNSSGLGIDGQSRGGKGLSRGEILNLFLQDSPGFDSLMREFKERRLPDTDCIALLAYEGEPLDAQIRRHCLNLQAMLFALNVFSGAKLPDEVTAAFFKAAGALHYALFHHGDYVRNESYAADSCNISKRVLRAQSS